MTEQLGYQLVRQYPRFELRQYPEHALVSVTAGGDFASATSRAFGALVGYISGRNVNQQRIAMTAPVLQHETERGSVVSFVLPAHISAETAPAALDADLAVTAVGGHRAAAMRFSGGWSEVRARRYADALRNAVREAGLETVGPVRYARFDPPWKPPFMRHNEVIVEVRDS